jgi:hypothetical protein
MKYVKAGNYVSVLNSVDMKKNAPNDPVPKFQHGKVVTVADQDNITVSVKGGAPMIASRLTSPPSWRVNKFDA